MIEVPRRKGRACPQERSAESSGCAVFEWATDADGFDSAALRALVDELTDLMNAYNHEGTDVARRFIGRVRTRIVD
ncbi:hypothetical protein [Nocardia sp. NPDC005825]|uniref:hypothetical protein n=1 Tax=unclassified Nocardia TaxID=2637762 RepID=UPI0033DA9120